MTTCLSAKHLPVLEEDSRLLSGFFLFLVEVPLSGLETDVCSDAAIITAGANESKRSGVCNKTDTKRHENGGRSRSK